MFISWRVQPCGMVVIYVPDSYNSYSAYQASIIPNGTYKGFKSTYVSLQR